MSKESFNYSATSWKLNLLLAICLVSSVNCALRSPTRLNRQAGYSGHSGINPLGYDYLPPVEQQQQQQIDDYPLVLNDRYPPINNVHNTVGTKQANPARGYGGYGGWQGFGGGKTGLKDRPAGVKY